MHKLLKKFYFVGFIILIFVVTPILLDSENIGNKKSQNNESGLDLSNIGSSGPISDYDYEFFKNITINSSQVFGSGSHSNFSVFISLFDMDLQTNAKSDGSDIAFAIGNNWLEHELVNYEQFYNATHAQLNAWVRIPALSTSTDTIITMYYGNSIDFSRENSTGVWNSSYKGVWHLEENPDIGGATIKDSTINENNGTAQSMSLNDLRQGQIMNGHYFDASNNYLDFGNLGGGIKTISFWIKPDDLGLTYNTSYREPHDRGDFYDQWTKPEKGERYGGEYASETTNNDKQDWFDFNIDTPNGYDIVGIQVDVRGDGGPENNGVGIELSWNGGNTFTSTGYSDNFTDTFGYKSFGGPSGTWGRSWTRNELDNNEFYVRLNALIPGAGDVRVDYIRVMIYTKAPRKIVDFDGSAIIEINQSLNEIFTSNFPGTTAIYVDGELGSTISTNWHYITITDTTGLIASSFRIGRVSSYYFKGMIDEVKISTSLYSAERINTSYANQIDPSSFYSLSIQAKPYYELKLNCLDHDDFPVTGINVTILNASNNDIWDNPISNSNYSDQNGEVVFTKLRPANYTLNFTYGEKYNIISTIREIDLTISDDTILTVNNLNLTTLNITVRYSGSGEPVYNAKLAFFEDTGTPTTFIGNEFSDTSGKVSFIWFNQSKSVMNYSFYIEKLGENRSVNGSNYFTSQLENFTQLTVFIQLTQDQFDTYLNLEGNTKTLMNDYYWGELIPIEISYGWVNVTSGAKNPVSDATVLFSLLESNVEIYSGSLTPNGTGGYLTSLNSISLGLNTSGYIYSIEILATRGGYDSILRIISLELQEVPMQITPENNKINFEINWMDNLSINVRINDTYNLEWMNDANITYEEERNVNINGNCLRNTQKGDGWYNFTLNSIEFPSHGSYIIQITAKKNNFTQVGISVYLDILQINTFINGTIFYPIPFSINVTDRQNFFFNYTDDKYNPISEADVKRWELQNLENISEIISGDLDNMSTPGIYKIVGLDTAHLETGSYSLVVRISKNNYIERQSLISLSVLHLETLLNGTSFLPFAFNMKVTTENYFYFNYTDLYNNPIRDADVTEWILERTDTSEEFFSGILNESIEQGLYKIEGLNTSILKTGSYTIEVRISNQNYTEKESLVSLEIEQIPIIFGEDISGNIYSETKGNFINISLTLIDTLSNSPLTGINIWIEYKNKFYPINETFIAGTYNYTIDTNQFDVFAFDETFQAVISFGVNENYTISDIIVTVQVSPPLGLFNIPLIYWIIGMAVGVFAIVSYITIKGIKYARIPMLVKQIDATSKSIKKNKHFSSIKITSSRDEMFEEMIQENNKLLGLDLIVKITDQDKKLSDNFDNLEDIDRSLN